MGHDLGHAPFGHAGEHALDELLSARFGRRFHHNLQSRRVVEVLERDGAGLNLTREVRDGIEHHTGPGTPATLEGQIVRVMDRIAYVNHDIEDAERAGVLDPAELPAAEIGVLGSTTSERLTTLVDDIVAASAEGERIAQSPEVGEAFLRLRRFMFRRVYLAAPASEEAERARGVVQALFTRFHERPELLPPAPETDLVARVTDFISGMTDRYALRLYRDAFVPREGPL
jgi:dGTPase